MSSLACNGSIAPDRGSISKKHSSGGSRVHSPPGYTPPAHFGAGKRYLNTTELSDSLGYRPPATTGGYLIPPDWRIRSLIWLLGRLRPPSTSAAAMRILPAGALVTISTMA
jgi:hypothetical protein